MSLEGSIGEIGTPEIFQLILRQQKEGILTFTLENEAIFVKFKKGRIVLAGRSPEEESLGEALVRFGKISKDQLESGLKAPRKEEESLGHILCGFGYVTPKEIKKVNRLVTEETIFRLLDVKSGYYKFEPKDISYDTKLIEPLILTGEFTLEGGKRSVEKQARSLLQDIEELPRIVPTQTEIFQELTPLVESPPQKKLAPERTGFTRKIVFNSVAIIVFMTALAVSYPSLLGRYDRARLSFLEVKNLFVWNDLDTLSLAIDLYYLENRRYPDSLYSLIQEGFIENHSVQKINLEKWGYHLEGERYFLYYK